mmetsp:Transcript_6730/g.19344  ORF Transcript_6730/g.19344 Transcript_6730/m.19344 type:complete len:776 (-) Transcript_6730:157-2484(-)
MLPVAWAFLRPVAAPEGRLGVTLDAEGLVDALRQRRACINVGQRPRQEEDDDETKDEDDDSDIEGPANAWAWDATDYDEPTETDSGRTDERVHALSRLQLYAWNPIGALGRRQAWARQLAVPSGPVTAGVPSVFLQYLRWRRRPLPTTLFVRVGPAAFPSAPAVVFRRTSNAAQRESHRHGAHLLHGGKNATVNATVLSSLDAANDVGLAGGAPAADDARQQRARGPLEPCALPSKPLHRLPAGRQGSVAVAYNHRGSLLVVAACHRSRDDPARERAYPLLVYDADSGACLQELHGHCGVVYSLTWSADDTMLASSSADGTVRLWYFPKADALTGLPGGSPGKSHGDGAEPKVTFRAGRGHGYAVLAPSPPKPVYGCAFVPGLGVDKAPGKRRFDDSASHSPTASTAALHSGQSGPQAWVLLTKQSGELELWHAHGAEDDDGHHVAVRNLGELRTRDERTGHEAAVTAVCADPRTGRLVSGDADGVILIWMRRHDGSKASHYSLLKRLRHFDIAGAGLSIMSMSLRPSLGGPRRKAQLLVLAQGNVMRLFDLTSHSLLNAGYPGVLTDPPGGKGLPYRISACFSPDGVYVFAGGLDGHLRIWDAQTGRRVLHLNAAAVGSDFGHASQSDRADFSLGYRTPLTAVAFHPRAHVITLGSYGPMAPALSYYAKRNTQLLVAAKAAGTTGVGLDLGDTFASQGLRTILDESGLPTPTPLAEPGLTPGATPTPGTAGTTSRAFFGAETASESGRRSIDPDDRREEREARMTQLRMRTSGF